MARYIFLRSAFLLLIWTILLPACHKADLIRDLFHGHGNNRCDWSTATTDNLSDPQDNPMPYLFQKIYKPGTNEMTRIVFGLRNIVFPPITLDTANVTYKDNMVIFVRPKGDTMAVLTFNVHGTLVKALAIPFMMGNYWNTSERKEFRFLYAGNKLSAIEYSSGGGQWQSYIKPVYDSRNRNIAKVLFGNLSDNMYQDSIVYVYDYTRKAKAQFYPDEMRGDHHDFWYFLKYLNVWEEIQPENILLRSYMTSDYPGLIERRYEDHSFDATGKLISYKHYRDHPVMPVEEWRITWRCLPD